MWNRHRSAYVQVLYLDNKIESSDNIQSNVVYYRLNEQLKPIVDLLRETENVVLTSEVLEPTLQGIKNVCDTCMYMYMQPVFNSGKLGQAYMYINHEKIVLCTLYV